jgi:hypothetical protein
MMGMNSISSSGRKKKLLLFIIFHSKVNVTYFQSKHTLKNTGNTLVNYNASKKTKNPDAMIRIS